MLRISRNDFSARSVFDGICSGISDARRRERLVFNAPKIERAAHDYEVAGLGGTIHAIVPATYAPYGTATTADFVWLYDQRLVSSVPGRVYYRSIRDSNGGRCALCTVRGASTLDHHLPKTVHPIFAVCPDNLVPSCKDCNTTKLASVTATLNPYFDDLGDGPWLEATVAETSPATFDFKLVPQPTWSADLTARAQAHFDLFGLARFYAFQADRQVAGIRHILGRLDRDVGPHAVQLHLQEFAESWSDAEPNSWEAALYAALAGSDWFINGGHAAL